LAGELFSLILSDLFWLHFALSSKHRPQAHAPNLAIIPFSKISNYARAQNLPFAFGSTTYLIDIWGLLQFCSFPSLLVYYSDQILAQFEASLRASYSAVA
jgi:hypothetical protein